MDFTDAMIELTEVIEAVGVAIIVLGGAHGLFRSLFERAEGESYYEAARRSFGRPLLLGLEVLVAADIIATVTVDRSLESVVTLGILVLVRVVLSFSLDVEIDGILPWRRLRYEHPSGGKASQG